MLLKDMGESFLLSEDEPLTLNIDGVMALWIFRRRAQTAENRRKSAIIGPFESIFYLFSPPPPGRFVSEFIFPSTTEPSALGKKLRYTGEHEKGVKINPPIWYSPFPHTNPLFCTLGQGFDLIFWCQKDNQIPSVIQKGHAYETGHFLGHSEGVYMPQSVTQA